MLAKRSVMSLPSTNVAYYSHGCALAKHETTNNKATNNATFFTFSARQRPELQASEANTNGPEPDTLPRNNVLDDSMIFPPCI
jgi:hypothetical protein